MDPASGKMRQSAEEEGCGIERYPLIMLRRRVAKSS